MPKLSDPINIRGMEVKNRIGFPPMLTQSSDTNGCPTEKTFNAYETKARGGVGLITYEAVSPDPRFFGIGGNQANLSKDENIPAYKKLTDAVHKYGAKIGIQIAGGGLIEYTFFKLFNFDLEPIGPSKADLLNATSAFDLLAPNWADVIKKSGSVTRALDIEEIIKAEDLFAAGAKRAIQAGFDFVEIHSAHGTLHSSFLSPYLNKRTSIICAIF